MSSETSTSTALAETNQQPGFGGEITAAAIGAEGGGGKKRLPLHIVAIAVVMTLSAGALYGMRYLGLGPRATIASDLPALKLPETAGRAIQEKAVMDDLGSSRTTRQVPVEKIRTNPFVLKDRAVPSAPAAGGPGDDGATEAKRRVEDEKRREQDWQRSVAADLDGLKLNGVIGGSSPRARINGELKTVGDRVGKFFTVKAISTRSVELEDDGHRLFTIEMK